MSLEINLVRNSNHANDDKILVRKRHNQAGYMLRYKDAAINSVWVNEKTSEQVFSYIEDTLRVISADADPFTHVQVSIPGFPVIFLPHNALTADMINIILDNVYDFIYSPPASFVP